MEIHFIKRSDEVTPAMKEYVDDKLAKIEKLPVKIIDARIIMDIHKYRHFVEVTLLGKHLTINAKDEDSDMYTAIDRVMDKLEGQVRKYKDIKRDHKVKNPGRKSGVLTSEEGSEEQ